MLFPFLIYNNIFLIFWPVKFPYHNQRNQSTVNIIGPNSQAIAAETAKKKADNK